MSAVASLKKVLKKDDTWKAFKGAVSMAWNPAFDSYIDEIKRLHKTRELRELKGGHVKSSKIGSAALNDQAARSRCVEIAMEVTVNRNELNRAIKAMSEHIEAHYTKLLVTKGCKTKVEQRSIVNSCLRDAHSLMERMETLVEISDMVTDDIDQGGYSIKHALEAMSIASKRSFAGG